MSNIQFNHYVEQHVDIVAIAGNITSNNVSAFNEFVNPIISSVTRSRTNHALLLDFKGVPLIDSSGIGVICGKYIRLKKAGKKLALCSASRVIIDMLAVTGLDKTLSFYQSVPESLAILGTVSAVSLSDSADIDMKSKPRKRRSLDDFIDEKLKTRS